MQWGMTRCANGLFRAGSTQFNDVYLPKSGSESQTVSRFFIPAVDLGSSVLLSLS